MRLRGTRLSGTGENSSVVDPITNEDPSLDLNFAENKSLIDDVSGNNLITFTRSSSATFVGSNGLIQTATTNTPRFEYSATGESLGLLLEEASTNIINSNYTTSSPIGGSSLSEDPAITNPDGTAVAIKVTALANNSRHEIQKTSGPPATTHTHSVFVKKGNHRYVGLAQGGASNNIHMIFDLDTKTITDTGAVNNGTFESAGFEEYANGWFRLHLVGTTGGSTLRTFMAQNDQQDGLANWTATGNEFFYIWGAQKEAKAFPTSFISSTSTATRAADVVEITGTNFSSFYNTTEGVFFLENAYADLASNPFVLDCSDGTSNNRHSLFYISQANPVGLRGRTRVSGADQDQLQFPVPAAGVFAKTAYLYKENDFAMTLGGASVATDNNGLIPTIDRVTIGATFANSSPCTGHIKRMAYFSTRLSNETLQLITS